MSILTEKIKETFNAYNDKVEELQNQVANLKATIRKLEREPHRCIDILPPVETPVFALVCGDWRKAELRWETPGFEDTFQAYQYWDCPVDDGQCWDWYDVTHWIEEPPIPEPYDYHPADFEPMQLTIESLLK